MSIKELSTYCSFFRTKCTRRCDLIGRRRCFANQKCLCDGQCGYSCVNNALSCGAPTHILNGYTHYSSTGYNATARYTCTKGYTLVDDKVRRCTAKGSWDRPAPNCLPDCIQPPIPPNAYIANLKKKYVSGDRVTFKCKDGFNQEGIPSTLCFMGRWNIIPFQCKVGGCGNPGLPVNGNRVGISYGVNSQVFFSCNLGYIRIGSEQRRCLPNNTWSGVQPVCKIVDCGKVKPPRNGSAIGDDTTFQKSITYKCDTGFILKGPKTVFCQSVAKWSQVSNCYAVDCGLPQHPKNGLRKGNKSTYTSTIEFACNPGYYLDGTKVSTCQHTGKWSSPPPKCQVRGCLQPAIPPNAYIKNKKVKYASGDRVMFGCKNGYYQDGIPSTLCFMGKWNIVPFKCTVGGCSDPGVPVNGNKVGISYGVNSEVFFSCNLGYIRIGSEQRCCLPNNTWSGVQPVCKIVDCGKVQAPLNGSVIIGKYTTFQKSITYKCDAGFKLRGPKTVICQSDAKWSQQSKCEAVDCGSPKHPKNGFIKGKKFTYTSTIEFACNPGYFLVGTKVSTCLQTGKWSSPPPKCQVSDCMQPAIPPNAYINNKKVKYTSGDRVTFGCKNGYYQEGIPSTLCFMGKWNIMSFKCTVVDCGKVQAPLNGSVIGKDTTFQKSITYKCNAGFILRGPKTVVCQSDGKWSQQSKCEAVECGLPKHPKNGLRKGDKSTYTNTIEFSCNPGYFLVGTKFSTCQHTGKWSSPPPKCQAVNSSCNSPLGLESSLLPDANITASSESPSYLASKARLNGPSSWCAADSDNLSSWIQVSFGERHRITTMTVQGNSAKNTWVKKLRMEYRLNGMNWTIFPKHIYGNSNLTLNTGKTIKISKPYIVANDIRLYPLESGSFSMGPKMASPPCLRLELFGCKELARCRHPGVPRDSTLVSLDQSHGGQARYKCNNGSSIVGSDTITCNDGRWPSQRPKCVYM